MSELQLQPGRQFQERPRGLDADVGDLDIWREGDQVGLGKYLDDMSVCVCVSSGER